ncbi:MAG TPA: MFS transporter [Vicinamibacterales bacterium]
MLGPFAAATMNVFGLRTVVSSALVLIASGIAGSMLMTELWQLMALWGFVIGIGTGMTALVLGATVATRWFTARRGLIIGLMTASNATGQLVFLPMLAALTEALGWRAALTVVVTALGLTLVLVLLLMRDRPADVGLPPYGETAVLQDPPRGGHFAALFTQPLVALARASRSATFWVLFGTFFVCGFSTNGLIQTHWIAICGDFGIAPVGAAGLLAMVGVFDLVGTVLAGWLSDRYDNRWLLFWFYGLRGLSLIVLSVSDFGLLALGIFAVFYGMDWIATVPPTIKLAAERFGRDQAPVVFGWIFAGHQLGAATAAYGAGWIRTDFLTYMPALQLAGALCIVAAMAVLSLRRGPFAMAMAPQS